MLFRLNLAPPPNTRELLVRCIGRHVSSTPVSPPPARSSPAPKRRHGRLRVPHAHRVPPRSLLRESRREFPKTGRRFILRPRVLPCGPEAEYDRARAPSRSSSPFLLDERAASTKSGRPSSGRSRPDRASPPSPRRLAKKVPNAARVTSLRSCPHGSKLWLILAIAARVAIAPHPPGRVDARACSRGKWTFLIRRTTILYAQPVRSLAVRSSTDRRAPCADPRLDTLDRPSRSRCCPLLQAARHPSLPPSRAAPRQAL